ncbi:MAG: arginine--tRNA ligase [Oscillospiraceae bacterium]|nr:arginine--tRNA ligase [Oscillospiraceae bacterium]
MSKLVHQATEQLKQRLIDAANAAMAAGDLPECAIPDFAIEVPADHTHGDYATNLAMVSAKSFHQAPRKIAEAITDHLDLSGTYLNRFAIAGPGFINFFLDQRFYIDVMQDIQKLGKDYGRSDYGKGEKVMVEFVSANPTGPMHMGNARGGALGDCLSAVLDAAGYNVWREFYVNDAGNQIEKFANSLNARYLQIYQGEDAVPFPEDGYQGEDIKERAAEFATIYGEEFLHTNEDVRKRALVGYALPKNIEKMQSDLNKYRITYDKWFLESELHQNGEVAETIQILKGRGMTYEKEGALWYKATAYGAEKDDVLVRQNGNPTYFAADIAYHRNKFQKRGFSRCIDIWGADHHGHVARMKGAMNAVGLDGDKLDVILMQLVRLVQDGEVVRMSKRTGKAIQLGDLLEEVPVDSARFFFTMREANTQMEFDLDLAVKEDAQNPVYYVQYARARICSIFRALAQDGIHLRPCTDEELALLTAPAEIELMRHLAAYTDQIILSAKDYNPSVLTRYVIELATLFHKFYDACRVKGDDPHLTAARMALCDATSTVICNVLTMFKISTPEKM